MLLGATLVAAAAPLAPAAHAQDAPATPVLERHEYRRLVMGTDARIVLYAADGDAARAAAAAAFREMDALDGALSDWNPDSELSRLSRTAGGPPVQASPALLAVLDLALEVAAETHGAFDPTLGPLTKLWRASRKEGRLPDPDVLAAARARTGWKHVALDRESGTVALELPGMELDLGAIAKGFACDRALDALRAAGAPRALVEIGGDLAAGDPPPGRAGWKVAIGCTTGGGCITAPTIDVARQGIATSGDTYQHIDIGGVRYSHILDPSTGLGLTGSACVTVVAPTGAVADALASAASVLGVAHAGPVLTHFGARVAAQNGALAPAHTAPARNAAGSAARSGAAWGGAAVPARAGGAVPADLHAPVPADAGAPVPADTGAGGATRTDTASADDDSGAGPWTTLFDGTTLQGWTTRGGRYDGDAVWTVEDGAITGKTGPNAAGGLIYTERQYSALDLEMEVWIDYPFDSGVFLDMLPHESGLKGLQVTLDYRPDGEVGGIYADGWLQHQPDGKAKWKRDAWNRVRVRQTGFDHHVEFWLNGEKITDFRLPADATGYTPHGKIGLQVHGGGSEGTGNVVRFREIRLRELPLEPDLPLAPVAGSDGLLALAPGAADAGWEDLLAGGTLDRFEKHGNDVYHVDDGVLWMPANADGGFLATKADYTDFRLRLDFAVPRMGNSGVYLRSARDGTNPSFSGAEIQILDDFHWEEVTHTELHPWQFCGSLYGAVPAGDHGRLHANGEWNTYEILVQGDRIATSLNGYVLYDVHTTDLKPEEGRPFPERAASGFLGMQTHGPGEASPDDRLAFRNVFVQRLK